MGDAECVDRLRTEQTFEWVILASFILFFLAILNINTASCFMQIKTFDGGFGLMYSGFEYSTTKQHNSVWMNQSQNIPFSTLTYSRKSKRFVLLSYLYTAFSVK